MFFDTELVIYLQRIQVLNIGYPLEDDYEIPEIYLKAAVSYN